MRSTAMLVVAGIVLGLAGGAGAQQVRPPVAAKDLTGAAADTVMTREYVEAVGRLAFSGAGRW